MNIFNWDEGPDRELSNCVGKVFDLVLIGLELGILLWMKLFYHFEDNFETLWDIIDVLLGHRISKTELLEVFFNMELASVRVVLEEHYRHDYITRVPVIRVMD